MRIWGCLIDFLWIGDFFLLLDIDFILYIVRFLLFFIYLNLNFLYEEDLILKIILIFFNFFENFFFYILSYTFHFLYFFLILFSLMFFFFNIMGLIPFFPCVTAQIYSNINISFNIRFGVFLLGFSRFYFSFFFLFFPNKVPFLIYPLVIILESISFLTRIFSLALRLFSNRLSGHSLLEILLDLILNSINFLILNKFLIYLVILSFFSRLILFVIFFFEIIVCFLQAYVWARLFLVYFNEVVSHFSHDHEHIESQVEE